MSRSRDTPPTFLWHTVTDDCVPVENSLLFFNALRKLEIPVEMHLYPVGGHGLSLANEETSHEDGGCVQKTMPVLDRTGVQVDAEYIIHDKESV